MEPQKAQTAQKAHYLLCAFCAFVVPSLFLILDTHAKLDLAFGADGLRDSSEVRRTDDGGGPSGGHRQREIRMIRNVEEFGSELNAPGFTDWEVLQK